MYGNPGFGNLYGESWNTIKNEWKESDKEDPERINRGKPTNFRIYAEFLRNAIDLGIPKERSRIPGARLSTKLVLPTSAGMFAGDQGGLIYLRQDRKRNSRYNRNYKPRDTFVWAPGEFDYLLIAAVNAEPLYGGEVVAKTSRQALDGLVRTINQEFFDYLLESMSSSRCPKMDITRVTELNELELIF